MKSVTLSLALAAGISWVYGQSYSGGSGTANDPYLISTKQDLKTLSETNMHWQSHFLQTGNIQFQPSDFVSGGAFYYNGEGFLPIGTGGFFDGNYDGAGYSIDGLYINRPTTNYVGLFSKTGNNFVLRNVVLTNAEVTGQFWVGLLLGQNVGYVDNCHVQGEVFGSQVMGLFCGINSNVASIFNSGAKGTISSGAAVGGFVGSNGGIISQCFADVVLGSSSLSDAGGFAYANTSSTAHISDCYAVGTLNGSNLLAGFVRNMQSGSINHCYSAVTMNTASMIGGFVQQMNVGVTPPGQCFYDMDLSPVSSAGGTGLTTLQMIDQNTFTGAGWDFVGETTNGFNDVWQMGNPCTNNGYPILAWQTLDQVPVVSNPGSVSVCAPVALPSLNAGNYFTGPGGTGTQLSAGTLISSTQSIYIYAQSGTCAAEDSFTVTITPLVAGVTNSNGTLTASEAGATYRWLDCGNNYAEISGETGASFTPSQSGNYAVEISQNGCTDTSACEMVTVMGLGDLGQRLKLHAYPNPVVDMVVVAFGSELTNVELLVMDMTGRVLQRQENPESGNPMDLSGFLAGPYIIQMNCDQGRSSQRIVKY